jgi:ferredoxin-NADP reductase
MPEGFLSSHLVDGVAPGTVVRLAAPQGEFVLPDPAPATVLFLTAGSGITPVMSMLRTLARRDGITDVVHLHSAPTPSDMLFADELAALARVHPGYRLQVRATRSQGRLDLSGPDSLDAEVPDWRGRQTWACGPAALLGDAERIWAAAGIADQLHIERFGVARSAVAVGGGTVTFAASGKSVAVDAATTLLEAGESVGVQMPFGCRMGICQSCVVELVDGQVRDLRTGVDHEPGTRIQTCVSAAAGACQLDV